MHACMHMSVLLIFSVQNRTFAFAQRHVQSIEELLSLQLLRHKVMREAEYIVRSFPAEPLLGVVQKGVAVRHRCFAEVAASSFAAVTAPITLATRDGLLKLYIVFVVRERHHFRHFTEVFGADSS